MAKCSSSSLTLNTHIFRYSFKGECPIFQGSNDVLIGDSINGHHFTLHDSIGLHLRHPDEPRIGLHVQHTSVLDGFPFAVLLSG
jgi:hypothetical protein